MTLTRGKFFLSTTKTALRHSSRSRHHVALNFSSRFTSCFSVGLTGY